MFDRASLCKRREENQLDATEYFIASSWFSSVRLYRSVSVRSSYEATRFDQKSVIFRPFHSIIMKF